MRAIKITGLFFIVALGLSAFLYSQDALSSGPALIGLVLGLGLGFAVLACKNANWVVWPIALTAFCGLGWFIGG